MPAKVKYPPYNIAVPSPIPHGIKRLKDSLTLEVLYSEFHWILDALIKDAVLGYDGMDIIWYSGDWLSGTWVKGEWYNGTWHNGTWLGGMWHSGVWLAGDWRNGFIWDQGNRVKSVSDVSPNEFFDLKNNPKYRIL